jgi:aspartyl-tRNA synthetase
MASNEGGTEEIDNAISTATAASKNLEHYIDLIEETIKTACRKSFPHSFTNKKNNHKSVPWWKTELTVMRKSKRQQKTIPENKKRRDTERRKEVYLKLRREYKTELKKARTSSWKEYCNVAASINLWSQI